MKRRRMLLFGLLCVGILFTLCLLGFALLSRRPALPNPNGWDDFVKAGEAVIDRSNWDSADDPDRQRALVATNSEALRLLHLGLTRECRFPLQRWRTNLNNLAPMFGSFKFLCHLL